MNWIVVYEKELDTNDSVHLTGDRHNHIITILKKDLGDTVQVVIPGSGNYLFLVRSKTDQSTTLEKQSFIPEVLRPLKIHTFFSLPRPQTAKKILHLAGTYGVDTLYFYATEPKNKEYWTSPVYTKDATSYLETGLSQTGNSRFPSVIQERTLSWKLFLKLWKGNVLVLDRDGEDFFSGVRDQSELLKTLFVFGPESGWKPDDLLFFRESGFQLLSLGKINLRTEFAYSALLHQLFSIRN